MITVSKKYRGEAVAEAYIIATALARGALLPDAAATKAAGYNVYRNPTDYYCYVCDLGDRLEVNVGAISENVWIQYDKTEHEPF